MTQHDLMMRVLEDAGGQCAKAAVPVGYTGKIADILFADDDVIIEVKSLTTDRAADPATSRAIGDMFGRSRHIGAPLIWGTRAVKLHDLEPKVAVNTLRIVGQRVRDEARAANRQIKATKDALGRPDALGVIALITPPFKLDRQSIAWLMGDAVREGRCSSIDLLFLVETPLAAPPGILDRGNSFLSFHSRPHRALPLHLLEAIEISWGRVTGQMGRRADSDDFHRLGATS